MLTIFYQFTFGVRCRLNFENLNQNMRTNHWLKITGLFLVSLFAADAVLAQTNDSIVSVLADVAELSPLAPDAVPASGTFWVVTAPDDYGNGVTAPFPCAPSGIENDNTYVMPNGTFLVDATAGDNGVSAPQLLAQMNSVSNLIQQAQAPTTALNSRTMGMRAMVESGPPDFTDTNSDGDTNYYLPEPMIAAPNYGTNLWIAQWSISNNLVTGIASNTIADVQYEFLTNSDLTTTNWGHTGIFITGSETTNWTALIPVSVVSTNNLFYRLLSYAGSSDGSGLPLWWEEQYFGTNDVDPYGNPAGDGYNNLYKYENGMNPNTFYQPAAPQGLTATYNASTGAATVTWRPSAGSVTGYVLTTPNSGTVTLSATNSSYVDNDPDLATALSGDPFIGDYFNTSFQLEASYVEGDSAAATVNLQPSAPNIWFVQGAQGSNFLAISALPPGTAAIRLSREDEPAEVFHGDNSFDASNDIPLSSFTNGLFYVPPGLTTAPLDAYGNASYDWWGQTVNSNGVATSQAISLGENSATNVNYGIDGAQPLYLDGRVQMKQDVAFQLRMATKDYPFGYYYDSYESFSYPTNYAFQGFYEPSGLLDQYYNPITAGAFDAFLPLENNYFYYNFAFDSSQADQGAPTTGVDGYDNFFVEVEQPTNVFQPPSASGTPITALLGTAAPWLITASYEGSTWVGTQFGEIGVSQDVSGYHLSGANYFGLSFSSVEIAYPSGSSGTATTTLTAGGSTMQSGYFYPQTAQPEFETLEYDFWNAGGYYDVNNNWQTWDLLPGEAGFAPTNQTDNGIIAPLGGSIQVAAYAKESLQNGNAGVYGYVGQYFDHAYAVDTNGNVTATPTGVLSPYGSFFPTQPGPAALVTMPDPDTGARGTGIVNAVSLQVDKNHDGTMDLSFNGVDATSQSSPMRVWINNDYDFSSGSTDPFGHDVESQYNANYKDPNITCPRDLEDWFRLWLCGVPVLTNGYQVTLGWANVSSGSPVVNLVNAVETNGGTLYLTDTNTAFAQVADYMGDGYGQKYRAISTTNTLTLPADLFTNGENKHFLFEGAGIGAGELTLTIADNYGNIIAQTGVWLDLHDIKDFYELARATNVTSSVPPSSLISQLQVIRTVSAAPDESKQIIVFVHGINNTDFAAQNTTETLFKRLYWSGYHGRVTEFRWPCGYLPFENTWYPYEYNESEFWAYKSAPAFKDYLNYLKNRSDLTGYDLDILAHSQGNAVASEALSEGAPFDNYILTQGAVPAQCYDGAAPTLSSLVTADTATPTPFYASVGGYFECWTNISGNLINFFNTNDFALATGTTAGLQTNWKENQRTQKPEAFIGGPSYIYYPSNETSIAYYTFGSSYTVSDWQESRAMVARSRTAAVGAQSGLSGNIKGQVDLQASFNFGSTRAEHSAEFTRPIQSSLGYYQAILNQIQPTP
jgi:predicted esterase